MGHVLLFLIIIFLGLRPINYFFVDMPTYAAHYTRYLNNGEITASHDIAFHMFMKFCSNFISIHFFFLLCIVLYVVPMYVISKKIFKEYWFYAFLLLISSFSFWSYGVNGIRNGLATSIFLMAYAYRENKVILVALLTLSCAFHKTMLLPTLAYILTLFFNDSKYYLRWWFLSIPLSLFLGGFWVSLFTTLGFGDERLSGYLTAGQNTSFRWDFLIYSGSAVFTGWYFIFKKGFNDAVYNQLFNIYLVCNGFWVMVIRANFSNRFAYLSWFMIALIIIYPYLKKVFFEDQHIAIGRVAFAYFGFTYFMYRIYYG